MSLREPGQRLVDQRGDGSSAFLAAGFSLARRVAARKAANKASAATDAASTPGKPPASAMAASSGSCGAKPELDLARARHVAGLVIEDAPGRPSSSRSMRSALPGEREGPAWRARIERALDLAAALAMIGAALALERRRTSARCARSAATRMRARPARSSAAPNSSAPSAAVALRPRRAESPGQLIEETVERRVDEDAALGRAGIGVERLERPRGAGCGAHRWHRDRASRSRSASPRACAAAPRAAAAARAARRHGAAPGSSSCACQASAPALAWPCQSFPSSSAARSTVSSRRASATARWACPRPARRASAPPRGAPSAWAKSCAAAPMRRSGGGRPKSCAHRPRQPGIAVGTRAARRPR